MSYKPDVIDVASDSLVRAGPEGECLGQLIELLVYRGQRCFVNLLVLQVLLESHPTLVYFCPALIFVKMKSFESCVSCHDGPAAHQSSPVDSSVKVSHFISILLVIFVLVETLHQLLLITEVIIPLPRDDGVSHHLVHGHVLGQQGTVATCLFLFLKKRIRSCKI